MELNTKTLNNGNTEITYTSILTKHKFRIEIDKENNEYCQLIDIDINDACVELAVLLELMRRDMDTRKIKYIIQHIYKEEWDNIISKLEDYQYVNDNEDNTINVKIETNAFPIAFMNGIGIDI